MEQTYRITQAGRNALESPRSVSDRYRAILGLLRTDTGYSAICGAMPAQGPKQVRTWVEQMETLFKSFSPMGDAGVRLFKQMMDIGLSGMAGKNGDKKD